MLLLLTANVGHYMQLAYFEQLSRVGDITTTEVAYFNTAGERITVYHSTEK